MTNELHTTQLKVYRQRLPLLWQRWDISPHADFAIRSSKRLKHEDDLPVRLDRSLARRRSHLPDPVCIGASSEPYPASEKKSHITRRCLEVIAKHGCPVILSTGSSLLLRDIDLLRELHEDSQATVGVRVPFGLFRRMDVSPGIAKSYLALLERVCRSGIQTGMVIEVMDGERLAKRRLIPFFTKAVEIGVDFIDIPALRQFGSKNSASRSINLTVKKSILRLAHDFKMRLIPKRYLPKDRRRENFWLAETLANHAFFLEMSGINAAGHWAAAKRIDNFDSDVRLWALRGDLIPLASKKQDVRLDMERFLRGERSMSYSGVEI